MSLCDVLVSIVVGVATGWVTSWRVALRYYTRGRMDQKTAYVALELDEVLLKIAELCPDRWESERGGDGVKDTEHWLLCKASIFEANGFTECAVLLQQLAARIRGRLEAMQQQGNPPKGGSKYLSTEATKSLWGQEIKNMRDHICSPDYRPVSTAK